VPELPTLLRHYRELRRLVSSVFAEFYGVVVNAGVGYSDAIFFAMTDSVLGKAKLGFCGASATLARPQQATSGEATKIEFDELQYAKESGSVTATLVGRTHVTDEMRAMPLVRIYGTVNGITGLSSDLPEPITLETVDLFEVVLLAREVDNLVLLAFARNQGLESAM